MTGKRILMTKRFCLSFQKCLPTLLAAFFSNCKVAECHLNCAVSLTQFLSRSYSLTRTHTRTHAHTLTPTQVLSLSFCVVVHLFQSLSEKVTSKFPTYIRQLGIWELLVFFFLFCSKRKFLMSTRYSHKQQKLLKLFSIKTNLFQVHFHSLKKKLCPGPLRTWG